MSSTTIRFRDAKFEANDTPIEVWMFEVARQIDANAEAEEWLDELSKEWRLQSTAGFGFGPSPALDRFLDTPDRRERLASYFRKTLTDLSQKGSVITADELSRLKIGGEDVFYTQELPTQMVTIVGEQFLSLVS